MVTWIVTEIGPECRHKYERYGDGHYEMLTLITIDEFLENGEPIARNERSDGDILLVRPSNSTMVVGNNLGR